MPSAKAKGGPKHQNSVIPLLVLACVRHGDHPPKQIQQGLWGRHDPTVARASWRPPSQTNLAGGVGATRPHCRPSASLCPPPKQTSWGCGGGTPPLSLEFFHCNVQLYVFRTFRWFHKPIQHSRQLPARRGAHMPLRG